MKILIVHPEYSKSFWSVENLFKMSSKKSKFPPKEILRTSILLPITWEKEIVNLNEEKLSKDKILWADYIIINAEEKQFNSAKKIIQKCEFFHKKVAGCGSLFNEYAEEFEHVDHLILDDIKITIPLFVNDLENNKSKKIYHSNPFFEIRKYTESYYSVTNISDSFSRNINLAYD